MKTGRVQIVLVVFLLMYIKIATFSDYATTEFSPQNNLIIEKDPITQEAEIRGFDLINYLLEGKKVRPVPLPKFRKLPTDI